MKIQSKIAILILGSGVLPICGAYFEGCCSQMSGGLRSGATNLGVSRISFDKLFPVTPFKKAFNVCMQLYSELDAAQAKALVPDIVVKKALGLQMAVDELIQTQEVVSYDDLEYMLALIEHIETRHTGFLSEHKNGALIRRVLRGVREVLTAVIES